MTTTFAFLSRHPDDQSPILFDFSAQTSFCLPYQTRNLRLYFKPFNLPSTFVHHFVETFGRHSILRLHFFCTHCIWRTRRTVLILHPSVHGGLVIVYTHPFCFFQRFSMRLSKHKKEDGGCNGCLGNDQACCIAGEAHSHTIDFHPAAMLSIGMRKSKYIIEVYLVRCSICTFYCCAQSRRELIDTTSTNRAVIGWQDTGTSSLSKDYASTKS